MYIGDALYLLWVATLVCAEGALAHQMDSHVASGLGLCEDVVGLISSVFHWFWLRAFHYMCLHWGVCGNSGYKEMSNIELVAAGLAAQIFSTVICDAVLPQLCEEGGHSTD